jgi:hypothetical protein
MKTKKPDFVSDFIEDAKADGRKAREANQLKKHKGRKPVKLKTGNTQKMNNNKVKVTYLRDKNLVDNIKILSISLNRRFSDLVSEAMYDLLTKHKYRLKFVLCLFCL